MVAPEPARTGEVDPEQAATFEAITVRATAATSDHTRL